MYPRILYVGYFYVVRMQTQIQNARDAGDTYIKLVLIFKSIKLFI